MTSLAWAAATALSSLTLSGWAARQYADHPHAIARWATTAAFIVSLWTCAGVGYLAIPR